MTLVSSTAHTFHLQMVRAVGENSFQPKIGFKTRYGLAANPFAAAGAVAAGDQLILMLLLMQTPMLGIVALKLQT